MIPKQDPRLPAKLPHLLGAMNLVGPRGLCFHLTMTAHEWAVKLGIPPKTLRQRIYRGWSAERALTEPLRVS